MSTEDKVKINKLPTGIPGLDEIVGGGLPEFSFNIIAGAPGSGKTTLAHQFVFANASSERPALYFTVLGESAIKMLRYQQQYTFFDPAKLPGSIRFVNLSQVVLEKDLGAVLDEITREVQKANPAVVVVDYCWRSSPCTTGCYHSNPCRSTTPSGSVSIPPIESSRSPSPPGSSPSASQSALTSPPP